MSGETVINLDEANTIITLNSASQLPTKLTGDNFPTWRAQLLPLLHGLDLLKFLDGTHPAPAADALLLTVIAGTDKISYSFTPFLHRCLPTLHPMFLQPPILVERGQY
ncbi:unnamed protein product [Linum trigynum]|uniref:Retrotransposon Copia-like N-terminal domain-containing protein n=1 Tax=Linum trigynum TaxID=586398 RepID=A0AAV2FX46_9ROSI